MDGIITKHFFNLDYFEVGAAFQFQLSTNNFKNGILTKAEAEKIVFSYFDKGEVVNLELTPHDVMIHDYWITKLKPDYENGKFKKGYGN